jgi:hypothetical protein
VSDPSASAHIPGNRCLTLPRSAVLTLVLGRVKCDQSRPECKRCLDTGRKCEGPGTHQIQFVGEGPITQHHAVLRSCTSLAWPKRDHDERWAFDHFVNRAAPLFAGVVDGPLWVELIPRLAQTYSFIWDAVISSSWMMERVEYSALKEPPDSGGMTVDIGEDHRKAIRWYQRALAAFRDMLDQGKADDGLVLLSCILFAALEFQQ